jgi:ppGpp synthetase/RelA/SpoT-type nucleotidyltranferase
VGIGTRLECRRGLPVLDATLATFSDADPRIAKDTRETADALRYRGLHVVVRLDDRLAEIQIRTSAQNLWAQLVEKLDEVRGTDLKHGVGPTDVLDGMKRLSELLRRQETGEERLGAGAAVLAALIAAAIVTMKASDKPAGD